MQEPKIKTKVVHSRSGAWWNVIGTTLAEKHKIAAVPYIISPNDNVTEIQRNEAKQHAEFISWCFNNSEKILSHERQNFQTD